MGTEISRRAGVILAGAVLLSFVVGGHVVLRMPGAPYNVKELADRHATLALISLGLLMLGSGAVTVGLAQFWRRRPYQFAAFFVPLAAAIASVVFLMVWLVVPQESVDDIVGSPVLGIGPAVERWLRFVGMFVGPLAAVTLGARLAWGEYRGRSFWLGSVLATSVMLISYLVVVPLTDTDNVVELLRGGGNIWAAAGVGGYFVLLGVVVAVLVRSLGGLVSGRRAATATGLFVMVLSVPLAWQLFVLATNPQLEKYDQVFSARQFLLSPDREHYLEDRQLFLRFAILQVVVTCVLTSGGAAANSVFSDEPVVNP